MREAAGELRVETTAGDVELALADPVDAQFSVRAFRGSFSTGLAIEPPPDEQRAEFTLGAGSARIRLESFSGRIRVDRLEGR